MGVDDQREGDRIKGNDMLKNIAPMIKFLVDAIFWNKKGPMNDLILNSLRVRT